MPRRRKPGSVRQKKEVDDLFLDSYKGTKKAIITINKLLDEGKPLSDEQFRFLKKAPDLIAMYENLEQGRQQKVEKVMPEGKLKDWVTKLETMQNKIIGATRNKRYKLTQKEIDIIADRVGYYRCEMCGNLHFKGKICMVDEYVKLLEKVET